MSIPVEICCGFTGTEQPFGTIGVSPEEIQSASELFGSNYILRMGLHYQRYVISNYLPRSPLVLGIYNSTNPAPRLVAKKRATSVTGNIGESIVGIVARRKLGAATVDVQPLNVTPKAKCPDFRIRINPGFPPIFQTACGFNPPVNFEYWPAESKAVESKGRAKSATLKALAQLGTYWFERRDFAFDEAGFGIVCCFIYKGTIRSPEQRIRLYVFVPDDQETLLRRIYFHQDNRNGFLKELVTPGSLARTSLKNG